ncbi:MAG: 3-isopropylmalate dehydratase small subunit [Chloroflexota bacterium]
MKLSGRSWKFGDNVDTDVILPARYMMLTDAAELASHVMEDSDHPGFASQVKPGDLLVAGRLFGLGSSREHAPISLKGSGVSAVIASSFARIFLRNAINIGLPVLENDTLLPELNDGDDLQVDLASGEILHIRTGRVHRAGRYPDFMLGVIAAGGLVNYTKQKMSSLPPPGSR